MEAKRKQLQAALLSSNVRRAKQFYKVVVKVCSCCDVAVPLHRWQPSGRVHPGCGRSASVTAPHAGQWRRDAA